MIPTPTPSPAPTPDHHLIDDRVLAAVMRRLLGQYANTMSYTTGPPAHTSIGVPAVTLTVTMDELDVLLRLARQP